MNLKKAMAQLGSIGGKANIKKNGKRRMKSIINDYWADVRSGKIVRKSRSIKKH